MFRVFRSPARCRWWLMRPRRAISVAAPRRIHRITPALSTTASRFGRSYIGDPAEIAEELRFVTRRFRRTPSLLTVPNQLGVDFNLKSWMPSSRRLSLR